MNRTQVRTTERFYFSTDHLGSVTAVTDEAGELVWANEYTPFGTVYNDPTGLYDQAYWENFQQSGVINGLSSEHRIIRISRIGEA